MNDDQTLDPALMVGFRLKAVEAARIEINGGAASVILKRDKLMVITLYHHYIIVKTMPLKPQSS